MSDHQTPRQTPLEMLARGNPTTQWTQEVMKQLVGHWAEEDKPLTMEDINQVKMMLNSRGWEIYQHRIMCSMFKAMLESHLLDPTKQEEFQNLLAGNNYINCAFSLLQYPRDLIYEFDNRINMSQKMVQPNNL